jgi:N-acyl-D-aspartate/D-glutamate deacylase
MSVEAAVHRLTGQPARIFGIQRRGVLKTGCAADLLLFDPSTVARGPRQRVRDLPAGGARLITPAVGVHGVWVNGVRVVDERGPRAIGRLPGRVLKEFDA